MTTIVKFLVTLLISLFFISCNFTISGKKGNGNVITKNRSVNENFSEIKAAEGLDVYLTQSTSASVKVQADENLHDLILTEIKGDVLHIHTKENIGKAAAKKVIVNFTSVKKIASSSGADVHSTNNINCNDIILSASSGSDLELDITANNIFCKASSGADVTLNGKSNYITAKASSGSNINAEKLVSASCSTDVSSGANIDVNCIESITAEASSGGDISYYGNPTSVRKDKSSSGSISKK